MEYPKKAELIKLSGRSDEIPVGYTWQGFIFSWNEPEIGKPFRLFYNKLLINTVTPEIIDIVELSDRELILQCSDVEYKLITR